MPSDRISEIVIEVAAGTAKTTSAVQPAAREPLISRDNAHTPQKVARIAGEKTKRTIEGNIVVGPKSL